MIELENLNSHDSNLIKKLVQNHVNYTSSKLAKELILNWETESNNFVKIMPTEYKLALEKMAKEKELENY